MRPEGGGAPPCPAALFFCKDPMKPIDVTLNISPQSPDEARECMLAILEALVRVNVAMYRRYPSAHCCPHCAGVKYDPARATAEAAHHRQRFVSADRLIAEQVGACGSIAAMVAARMRAIEGKPGAYVDLLSEPGRSQFHAVVRLPGGAVVDPSAELEEAHACACG